MGKLATERKYLDNIEIKSVHKFNHFVTSDVVLKRSIAITASPY
jgi:hypothetical protein